MNIAVILAGGVGSRMGIGRPKQFLELAGKTILEHSISAFSDNPLIDMIYVVSNPDFVDEVEMIVDSYHAQNKWQKVTRIIPGGKERSYSSLNAIETCETEGKCREINIIFHDAVRPLVDQRIITDVCEALKEHEVVNVTLPVADTIVKAHDGCMTAVIDRSTLQRVQTPQGFHLDVIKKAYDLALADSEFKATDDCGVVLRYLPKTPIFLVRGSEHNLKLTYPDDIPLFEFLLSQRKK